MSLTDGWRFWKDTGPLHDGVCNRGGKYHGVEIDTGALCLDLFVLPFYVLLGYHDISTARESNILCLSVPLSALSNPSSTARARSPSLLRLPRVRVMSDLADNLPRTRIILKAEPNQLQDLIHREVKAQLALHPQISQIPQVRLQHL